MLLLLHADFFQNNFFKKFIRNTIRVLNSLHPDQGRHAVCVSPDLGPHCLQRFSAAGKKSPLARKELSKVDHNDKK